jgi:hypothetical protein
MDKGAGLDRCWENSNAKGITDSTGSNIIAHLWINENTMHRHIPHLFTEIPFNVNDVAFICRFNIVFATDYLAYNL